MEDQGLPCQAPTLAGVGSSDRRLSAFALADVMLDQGAGYFCLLGSSYLFMHA